MAGIALTRERVVLAVAAFLGLVLAATFTHLNLTRASAGPLRHDDTVQKTKVDETWRMKHPEHGHCLVIRFTSTVAGNARSTWGLTGPATVWENLRLHGGGIRVDSQELRSEGQCGASTTMQKLVVGQQWKTGDGDWRGYRQTRVPSGKGSYAWTATPA